MRPGEASWALVLTLSPGGVNGVGVPRLSSCFSLPPRGVSRRCPRGPCVPERLASEARGRRVRAGCGWDYLKAIRPGMPCPE